MKFLELILSINTGGMFPDPDISLNFNREFIGPD